MLESQTPQCIYDDGHFLDVDLLEYREYAPKENIQNEITKNLRKTIVENEITNLANEKNHCAIH